MNATLTLTRYNDDLQMDINIGVTVSYDISGSHIPAIRDVSEEEWPEITDVTAVDVCGKEWQLTDEELARLYEKIEIESEQR